MPNLPLRVGLIGAGYISSWHAATLADVADTRLTAVCDTNRGAAEDLAAGYGARAFGSVAELLAADLCDVVHILTPPQTHLALAIECLGAGLHVLIEKPVGLSAPEVAQIAEAAQAAGKVAAAGHNFLALPSYEKLKAVQASGRLGRISAAEIKWCFPLPPLRSGPFSLWLLRAPQNLLLEIGPHLYAFAQDLFGPIEIQHLELGMPIALPGDGTRPQSWRILARAGHVEITFTISLVESFDDRSVTLRGSSGMARLDMGRDTLQLQMENAADIVLNPLIGEMSLAGQRLAGGLRNAAVQFVSLNQKSPYGLSFRGMLRSIYGAIARGMAVDPRFSIASATEVMRAIDATLQRMPAPASVPAVPKGTPAPRILVIGGTGFLGRGLTRALVEKGQDVRVLSRGQGGPFADLPHRVEMVSASPRDPEGLRRAMSGIDTVYNLAKSDDKTWEDALRNDVGVAVAVAEAALDAGVGRLIYTGTIASYDMSDPARTITEDTGFAADMADRNLYARSKAECEVRLMALHRDRGLPLVIARPGIVVGRGGPLQHWGIGRWNGPGAVKIWGDGRNILPFVLVDDVSDALVAMRDADGILGQTFNLIGEPMLTGRDYFDAIHAQLGARILVRSGNLTGYFLFDGLKYALKRHLLNRKGAVRGSLKDWKSRAHLSPFDNSKAKRMLGWVPESDRAAFVRKSITEANLFGF
ncbi:oxidoreductase [Defluviimonas sp. 20V17]|uniref:Predicted dehydrogenase n=1 Tax=Allgaiera indica TaxID=765699 RepID=A0AAN4UNJ3_9RHOB|nr:NAD-dependent epimerase/dehydratase family protein [Allgaiera indica]KDB02996.1 oxidoreductase [Defluviimonas sp. 20V17]GHD98603.1 hypothetical protein GCM10008024_02780 [Allgaiera indica]SDW10036.1 Predicted dehydrogenase [Allgaiera indica]